MDPPTIYKKGAIITMATRSMEATINRVKGNVPSEYDMRVTEMAQLAEIAQRNTIEALGMAFYYGFAMGGRAAKVNKYKETP